MHHYRLYGAFLSSEWSLPAPEVGKPADPHPHEPRITFRSADKLAALPAERVLSEGGTAWNSWSVADDGAIRFRWPGLFECDVSASGAEVRGAPEGSDVDEAFRTHLFGHVLSFALVRLGLEPLHMTVLEGPEGAIALTGDSGYGKSTLAAAFVASGHRLVTDDLLTLRRLRPGFLPHPGLPRLKLEPAALEHFLGERRTDPLAPRASKRLVPLEEAEWCTDPTPLRAVYVLQPPEVRDTTQTIQITPLSRSEAHIAVSASTFNSVLVDRDRLQRQFAFASAVAREIPVRTVAFPSGFQLLPRVCRALAEDST